jgi:outer membrane lipoprotein-sorting protein
VITAAARDGLPDRTAAQLLVDVQKARLDGLSGTIVQDAKLGLPSLPGVGGSGSSDMSSLVAGSHTLRVWYAGPDHVRVALQGSLGESDLVRSGPDLWTWSSSTKSATHHRVPVAGNEAPSTLASASPVTPQQAAEAALKAISPTTKVTTDGTAVVAGRSAYELVLQPKDTGSLVSSVRIAIDGRTHVPTRVQVYGGSSRPAFEVGFTAVDFSRPDPSMFRFNPPPGTKVTDSTDSEQAAGKPTAEPVVPDAGGAQPHVVGTGWTSVAVATVPSGAPTASGPGSLAPVLKALPKVTGSWGSGHLLQGSIFSAVLTDDGRVAIGAVAPDRLYAALAGS